MSLNDHGAAIMHRYGVDIKKQSIDERFNESSVDLLKELLRQQLESQLTTVVNIKGLNSVLNRFSAVKIKDSTRFQAPENLKEVFPGAGGASSEAGVHVQFEFDLLSGKICDLGFTDAKYQDNTDAKHTLNSIQPRELILRDLGYYSFEALEHIDDAGAFFISRRPSTAVLFDPETKKRIDYNAIYTRLKNSKKEITEIPAVTTQGLRVRLIAERLPKKQVSDKITKAAERARKRGHKLSDEYRSRARLNMFITNIPPSWIETKKVRKIYRLRWQIELCFKTWKSFYHIDQSKPMKQHRFECYLYGTLLLVMINWEMATNFSSILQKWRDRPLSILKFSKAVSQTITSLSQAFREGGDRLIFYLRRLYLASQNLLREEKKTNKYQFN